MNIKNTKNTHATSMQRTRQMLVFLLSASLLFTSLPVHAGKITRYVHTDHLGSPVAKTDSTGAVIWRQSYTPDGEGGIEQDPDGPGYTGHRNDAATGLVYMQARYYDPEIGRFLSVDPVTFSADKPQQFNRYWYANGNPYMYTDPDGEWALAALGVLVVATFAFAYWKAAEKVEKAAERAEKLRQESEAKQGESLAERFVRLEEDGFFERDMNNDQETIEESTESLEELAPSTIPTTGSGAAAAVTDVVIGEIVSSSMSEDSDSEEKAELAPESME